METLTHAIALECANDIISVLHPHCHRINIAGSVRRQKPLVSDIEIVCQPHTTPADIFSEEPPMRHPDFVRAISRLATRIIKGDPATGRYVQLAIGSAKIDLFMPQPDDYYRQLAIRTGSSAYSRIIATAWLRAGWCGTKDGLRLIRECYKNNSDQWICTATPPTHPPAWQSEKEFFDFIHLPYKQPQHREV